MLTTDPALSSQDGFQHDLCLILQDACRKNPKLHKNAAVLARDIAAVCTGLRGGVMVDYMPLSSSMMLTILSDVQSQQVTSWQFQCKLASALCVAQAIAHDWCMILACRLVLLAQCFNSSEQDTSLNTCHILYLTCCCSSWCRLQQFYGLGVWS